MLTNLNPIPSTETISSNLSERYEVVKLLSTSMYSATYFGKYKASNNSVLIEVSNHEKILEGLSHWKKSSDHSPILETILESGSFAKDLFFVISTFPVSSDYRSLFEVRLTLEQVASIGIQLCDVLQILHGNNLYYQGLDPTKVFVKSNAQKVELVTLRRKPFNHDLGFKFVVNNSDVDMPTPQADHDLERLYFASTISPFVAGTNEILGPDKILTHLAGWQYATLNPFIAPEISLGRNSNGDAYSVVMLLYWLITRKHLPDNIKDIAEDISYKLNVPGEIKNEVLIDRLLELVFASKLNPGFLLYEMPPELQMESILMKSTHPLEKRFGSLGAIKKLLSNISWKKLELLVKDSKGRPINNAVVQIQNTTYPGLDGSVGSTNSEGVVLFTHLPSGYYSVEVEVQGYYPEKKNFVITEDESDILRADVSVRSLSLFDRLKRE